MLCVGYVLNWLNHSSVRVDRSLEPQRISVHLVVRAIEKKSFLVFLVLLTVAVSAVLVSILRYSVRGRGRSSKVVLHWRNCMEHNWLGVRQLITVGTFDVTQGCLFKLLFPAAGIHFLKCMVSVHR